MIYDLSPTVSSSLAVWPGDTPPSREVLLDMQHGDNLTLSSLRSTVHAGSHADAPSHYGSFAPNIDDMPIERYLGPCQVVKVNAVRSERFGKESLRTKINQERVLFVTGTYPDPNCFNEDFAGVAPELIDLLAADGVGLIGVDTPSVDLFSSAELPAHKACLRNDVLILEGLVLDEVPEGVYELIALPLKIAGFDASPVRAVLRTLE